MYFSSRPTTRQTITRKCCSFRNSESASNYYGDLNVTTVLLLLMMVHATHTTKPNLLHIWKRKRTTFS